MLLPVPVDFFIQLPLVSLCLNRHDLFYVLFLVGVGSDMHSVNEDGAGVHKAAPDRFLQNVTEDPLKQIRSLKPALVILPKRQKRRDILGQIISDKPAVCHIHLYFSDCLPHTPDAVQILDKHDFEQHHGVDAGIPPLYPAADALAEPNLLCTPSASGFACFCPFSDK